MTRLTAALPIPGLHLGIIQRIRLHMAKLHCSPCLKTKTTIFVNALVMDKQQDIIHINLKEFPLYDDFDFMPSFR